MTWKPLALIAATVGGVLALAAEPLTLPAETAVVAGDFAWVRAETEGKVVRWVSLDPRLVVCPAEKLADSREPIVFAREPGRYRLLAYTAVNGEPTKPAYTVVVASGPLPPTPPPDPPRPEPAPGPNPRDVTYWVTVVEEFTARTPESARVLGDTGFWKSLEARGHLWRHYDQDNEAAAKNGHVAAAQRIGLPAVLLVTRDAPHRRVGPVRLHGSTAELDAWIKKEGGR